METLNIFFHVLTILMIIIGLFILINAIKHNRLLSVKVIDEKTKQEWLKTTKRMKVFVFLLLVCFSAFFVVSVLMFYPEPCQMQTNGFILAGFWVVYAVIYAVASVKNLF